MMKSLRRILVAVSILGTIGARPGNCAPLAITPFYSSNQSPLVQIHGLPAAETAVIQPLGQSWSLLAVDIANIYASHDTSQEEILLDGESYRLTLALRHGISNRLEIGMDLPFISYNGGIFDGFIEEWHSTFGFAAADRTESRHNRLLFTYSREGQERLRLESSNFSIGDVRLTGGWQLYDEESFNPLAVALRASLKLPTGSTAKLHGSGSTDAALWLTGSGGYQVPGGWGDMSLFVAAGGLAMTEGKVLKDQQQNLVGFGSLGFGWSPAYWIAFKVQLSSHTPFYKGSDLRELSRSALQLLIGGTYAFTAKTALDLAVSEDVRVATSPDVALHLGLSHQF